MSRILYVDDDPYWVDILSKALRDHDVETASSLPEALERLQRAAFNPYDLAIVDLNLSGRDDRLGGEILDALRLRYPETRRMVITGSPPSGSVKFNIMDRYVVQELVLKGRDSLPDLRRVVENALRTDLAALAPDVLQQRDELREKLHSRRRDRKQEAEAWIQQAGVQASNVGRLYRGELANRAQDELDRARKWRDSAETLYAQLGRAIDEATRVDELTTLSERLNSTDLRLDREKDGAHGG